MKCISPSKLIKKAICFSALFSIYHITGAQQNRVQKVQQLYDSLRLYEIEHPETVLASALIETGWMECNDCSLDMNNLFGFRLDNGYLHFSSYSECMIYLRKWQTAFYEPWKLKHPASTYYEFLKYVNYAQNMPDYIKNIKALEEWIINHICIDRPNLTNLYYGAQPVSLWLTGLLCADKRRSIKPFIWPFSDLFQSIFHPGNHRL